MVSTLELKTIQILGFNDKRLTELFQDVQQSLAQVDVYTLQIPIEKTAPLNHLSIKTGLEALKKTVREMGYFSTTRIIGTTYYVDIIKGASD
ncbi:MAG: hypothetical protein ACOYT4_03395 [Nanoarchaeota archaeon]